LHPFVAGTASVTNRGGSTLRRSLVFALLAGLALITAGPATAGSGHGNGHGDRWGHDHKHPRTIALPTGWQPEGIAIKGSSVYVGSIPTGAVWKGDVHSGQGATLVPPHDGRAAIGVEVDRKGRLWVAGGGTGQAYVYDAETGADVAAWQLAAAGPSTFINDVAVTRDAVWFTDSTAGVLYKLPLGDDGALPAQADVQTVPLTGDWAAAPSPNANGIVKVHGGRWLIVVQTTTGKLFRVDASTGAADEIDLHGGNVLNGDGLLLDGRTLYVVQNRLNQVAVVKLSWGFDSGKVKKTITDDRFNVPTTLAEHGKLLYTVNAKFGIADPGTQPYEIVAFKKPGHHGHHRGHKH
jgi:sugar lactone lactonase YvrE